MSGFNKHYFTESETWTVPEDVYTITAFGCGGGGEEEEEEEEGADRIAVVEEMAAEEMAPRDF